MRFGSEGNSQIDQPLSAVRQIAGLDILDALEPEKTDQFGGFSVDIAETVDVTPDIEAGRMAGLERKTNVFGDR